MPVFASVKPAPASTKLAFAKPTKLAKPAGLARPVPASVEPAFAPAKLAFAEPAKLAKLAGPARPVSAFIKPYIIRLFEPKGYTSRR